MTNDEILHLGEEMLRYCKKFNVPLNYLFEILEDQKVTPMIRGKAMEYNAYLLLDKSLPKSTWSVQKLNLNAQPGQYDEDISITHRRTGIILKVESKSAVRGSVSEGKRSRNLKVPHFKVKCHRSRSNVKLAESSNDRYSVDSFDLLVTNTTNAVFEGGTVGETLEIVHNIDLRSMLFDFYKATTDLDLIAACEKDWRFVIPTDIAEDGYLPRTPFVTMENDPHWRPIAEMEQRLLQVVEERLKAKNKRQTASRRS